MKETPKRDYLDLILLAILLVASSIMITTSIKVYNHQYVNEYVKAEITGYSSEVNQTDSTPFIMASGKRVFNGAIACPSRYDFGTRLLIKNRVYVCTDRMNVRYRYGNYFDIYFPSKTKAIEFGRQELIVQILR